MRDSVDDKMNAAAAAALTKRRSGKNGVVVFTEAYHIIHGIFFPEICTQQDKTHHEKTAALSSSSPVEYKLFGRVVDWQASQKFMHRKKQTILGKLACL